MEPIEAILARLRDLHGSFGSKTTHQVQSELGEIIDDLAHQVAPWEEDPEAHEVTLRAHIDRSAGLALNANFSGKVGGK